MRVTHDPEVDAAYVYLTDEVLTPGRDSVPCDAPDGDRAFVVLDWKDGRIAGLEVLDASVRLHPDLLEQAFRPEATVPSISAKDAFEAMRLFLCRFNEREPEDKRDTLNLLLSWTAIWADGGTADPAQWHDWTDALDAVRRGETVDGY